MIKEAKGNLLEANEDIIAHQVNCIGVMGAGVSKQIKKELLSKEQFSEYRTLCKMFGSNLLGSIQKLNLQNGQYLVNLFGEDVPTGKNQDTDYDALKTALAKLCIFAESENLSIALPGYLGCGLAGGDWEIVWNMIHEVFDHSHVNVTINYIDQSIHMLWNDFGAVPMDPKTECIEEDWHGFKAGTFREDIWKWFEETLDISVHDLMYRNV